MNGNKLEPQLHSRKINGLKSPKTHHVITNNPSSGSPGETLYVRIPKLTSNTFFVPGSFYLSADVKISGDDGNSVVNNLGRNLISKLIVKFGAEELYSLSEYNLYSTFKDLWLTKSQRENLVFQGIQETTFRALRSVKKTTNDATHARLLEIYKTKYKIPLDFELLTTEGPLFTYAIEEDLIFELTLSPVRDIIVTSTTKGWNYELKNICLEYDTVSNPELARSLSNIYDQGMNIPYDYVTHLKSYKYTNQTVNENINIPRKSVKGILILFTETFTDGAADSEKFVDPKIEDVQITIEGIANQVFAQGMRPLDQWPEIKKHFMNEKNKINEVSWIDLEKYHAENKFGLWIDLRTTDDNMLHGTGRKLQNTQDGIQLAMKIKEVNKIMHIFVVCDAQFQIQNRQLISVER